MNSLPGFDCSAELWPTASRNFSLINLCRSSSLPVRKNQRLGSARKFSANRFNSFGLSRSGSTVKVTIRRSGIAFSFSCKRARVAQT